MLLWKMQGNISMADHGDAGPEYKVFVGGISWQMDDTALMKGAFVDLAVGHCNVHMGAIKVPLS
jgi:hypothetical protein